MAPFTKRRKIEQPEELKFDPDARQDYLTGFHKRKLQRIKHAQEEAVKREREERVRDRRQLREQRKEDLVKHVAEVNALLRKADPDASEAETDEEGVEWGGIEETAKVDGTDEYVDEDKYTTVTIEAMDDPKEALNKEEEEANLAKGAQKSDGRDGQQNGKRAWTKQKPAGVVKKKKPKFRYESKAERKVTRSKQNNKNSAAAKERRAK